MSMVGMECGETTTAQNSDRKGKPRKASPVQLNGQPLLRVAALMKPVERKNHCREMGGGTRRREIYRHK
jgi:hypothetical protein